MRRRDAEVWRGKNAGTELHWQLRAWVANGCLVELLLVVEPSQSFPQQRRCHVCCGTPQKQRVVVHKIQLAHRVATKLGVRAQFQQISTTLTNSHPHVAS
jgi:hypothetical protein